MLCERFSRILLPHQAVDQAAYRKHFSGNDHLFVVTQLIEKSREFNIPLWFVLIDYEKAFDTVERTMLWKFLSDQGLPNGYITLLQRLYSNQFSYVKTSVSSGLFPVLRGVRQGDPLSAMLFISIMEHIFGRLKVMWRRANLRRKFP